jgi:cell division protein FtsQ
LASSREPFADGAKAHPAGAPRPRVRRSVGTGGRTAIGILVAAGALALAVHSPLFSARTIHVAGTAHLSRGEVLAAAGVGASTNVFFADASAIERRLETDPWIERAAIAKEWPSALSIAIVERAPVVAVRDGPSYRILAADGTDLGRTDDRGTLPLARASGRSGRAPETAAAAVAAVSGTARAEIASVVAMADGELSLRLRSGARIALGAPRDLKAKGKAVAALMRWSDRAGTPLERADVSVPTSPTATLRRRHGSRSG